MACLQPWVVLLLLLFSSFSGASRSRQISGPVKTVVVLVMENRSFDHILGWLKRLNPEIDGVTGGESNPLSTKDPNSPRVFFSETSEFVDPDPGHSFQAIREQIFGGNETSADPPPMNGFAQQAEGMATGFSHTVMSGFRPEVVPVFTGLAMEFAVCDRWFASVPASTQPNRFYIHSATSYGAMSNVRHDLIDGFPQRTIFDDLDSAGLSFGIYYQNVPTTLFFESLRKVKYVRNFHRYESTFKRHARKGSLPNYAVIEQRYFDLKISPANDDHPSHDLSEGQKLIKEVYETLRASPQWEEMLFIITYDEHGGFYDHVPTPVRGVPNPDGLIGNPPYFFNFDRLGVRIPTLLISPWINKGTVLHAPNGPTVYSQFEHSSIPATIRKLFNLDSDFLTKREAWAGTFDSLLHIRDTPRTDCPVELPSPPWSLRHSEPNEGGKLTEFQEELVQLAAQLAGDHMLESYPSMGKSMTVKQANDYCEYAVARFLKVGIAALDAGTNTSEIIRVEPTLYNRRVGSFDSPLLQSS